MDRLRVPRPVGRPRITPDVVLAEKAYSSRAIRLHLRRREIRAVIPQPPDQAANRKRRINKLRQWRGLATRYDETATSYQATVHLAAILIWLAR